MPECAMKPTVYVLFSKPSVHDQKTRKGKQKQYTYLQSKYGNRLRTDKYTIGKERNKTDLSKISKAPFMKQQGNYKNSKGDKLRIEGVLYRH